MPRPARKKVQTVVSPVKAASAPTVATQTKPRGLRSTLFPKPASSALLKLDTPIKLSSKKAQPKTTATTPATKTRTPFKDIPNSASPVKRASVLAQSTPVGARKRLSGSAFEDDEFGSGSLKKTRRAKTPANEQVQSESTVDQEEPEEEADLPQMSVARNKTPVMDEGEESSVDFNYSSSPPRVLSPLKAPVRLDDEEETSEIESSSDLEEDVEEEDEEEEEVVVTKRASRSKPAPPPTTEALQSLLPRRRAATQPKRPARRKAGNVVAKFKSKPVPPPPARKALRDVTHKIVDDIDDLDNPLLQLHSSPQRNVNGSVSGSGSGSGSAGLGRSIYVDSSAESSPQKASRKKVGKAKTYAKRKEVEEEDSSDKENSGPSFDGAANAGLVKEELEKVKEKFREVDQWGLEFEDETASSDGVVKGGR